MKKMNLKRNLALGLGIILAASLSGPVSADANRLHPCGLAELHENIPGIEQASSLSRDSDLARSADLTSKFPPVGDQDLSGSCVAWATGYALKTEQEGDEHGWDLTTQDHQFSPAYIYNQIHLDNSPSGGGAYFGDAFYLMVNQGCTTLSDMPYNGKDYGYKTQPTEAQKENASHFKAKSWKSLGSGNVDEAKARLANGEAVVIGVPIYPDFDNLNAENSIYDDLSGDLRGYHALCIVGYDDSKQAFKIINSWGTGWGIDGFGWISYDVVKGEWLSMYIMEDIIGNN